MTAMPPISAAFSASYREARDKFLRAAQTSGAQMASLPHPLSGRDGEALALDIAYDGERDAPLLLILSSGCHGVEGYCGSGVQVHALQDAAWRSAARAAGVAVLYLHALNPYGFSHLRRVTHENVDLNRNFQNFSRPLPENAAYRALHPLLLPPGWPPDAGNQVALAQFVQAHGMRALQAATSQGQYEFADGLFFGGRAPSWSNLAVRQALRDWAGQARRIAWIDLHTGLGPEGVGERIYAGREDAAELARARAWWGPQVTSIYDGSSSSALLTGLICAAAYEECPQAQYTGIALEYGTQPLPQVLQALRAEHWLNNHPGADTALAAQIKRDFLQAFYTDTDAWKAQVVQQAREAMQQALGGLREA